LVHLYRKPCLSCCLPQSQNRGSNFVSHRVMHFHKDFQNDELFFGCFIWSGMDVDSGLLPKLVSVSLTPSWLQRTGLACLLSFLLTYPPYRMRLIKGHSANLWFSLFRHIWGAFGVMLFLASEKVKLHRRVCDYRDVLTQNSYLQPATFAFNESLIDLTLFVKSQASDGLLSLSKLINWVNFAWRKHGKEGSLGLLPIRWKFRFQH